MSDAVRPAPIDPCADLAVRRPVVPSIPLTAHPSRRVLLSGPDAAPLQVAPSGHALPLAWVDLLPKQQGVMGRPGTMPLYVFGQVGVKVYVQHTSGEGGKGRGEGRGVGAAADDAQTSAGLPSLSLPSPSPEASEPSVHDDASKHASPKPQQGAASEAKEREGEGEGEREGEGEGEGGCASDTDHVLTGAWSPPGCVDWAVIARLLDSPVAKDVGKASRPRLRMHVHFKNPIRELSRRSMSSDGGGGGGEGGGEGGEGKGKGKGDPRAARHFRWVVVAVPAAIFVLLASALLAALLTPILPVMVATQTLQGARWVAVQVDRYKDRTIEVARIPGYLRGIAGQYHAHVLAPWSARLPSPHSSPPSSLAHQWWGFCPS